MNVTRKLLGLGLALIWSWTNPAVAETTLRAVSMFPDSLVYTQSFLTFVGKVNDKGKRIVQIHYVGGPEALPTGEQAEALRNGVIDMVYGPASFYPGLVPETDALVGSNLTPAEQRQSGGIDLLNEIHQRKMNAYYLAHVDGGLSFHIYLRDQAPTTADGGIDLTGLKLRAGPFYREFFTALGAVFVNIPAPEVYTALERGTVDGIGWTSIGVMDFSWDKHLKTRIDPGFAQTDLSVLVNLDRWRGLDDAARALLTEAALAYEQESLAAMQALAATEDAELRRRGIKVVTLADGPAKDYLAAFDRSTWQRLKGRDASNYQALRQRFVRE